MPARRFALLLTLPLTLGAARAGAYNMVFTPASASVNEAQGTLSISVSLSGCTSPSNTVNWSAFAESGASPPAQPESDFGAAAPTTFPVGEGAVSTVITVKIVNDTVAEPTENMRVVVRPGVNSELICAEGPRLPLQNEYRALVGIVDNDSQPTVSIGDTTVTEGDTGTRNAVFRVRLQNAGDGTASVNFLTRDGSAVAPADYLRTGGAVTLTANRPTADVVVAVVGDLQGEGDEAFFVDLVNPDGAVIGDGRGRGTIRDDDGAPPGATVLQILGEPEREVTAGDAIELAVSVSRDGSPVAGAVVNWTATSGGALEGGSTSVTDQAGVAAKVVLASGSAPTVSVTASSGEASPVTFLLLVRRDLGNLFDPDEDPGLASIAEVIDEACTENRIGLATLCEYLDDLGDDDARQAISEIAPTGAASQTDVAIETARANLRAVGERQRQLRQAARRGSGGGSVTLDLSLPRPADARVSSLGAHATPVAGTTWTEGSPQYSWGHSAIARLWSRVETALDAGPGAGAAQEPAEVEPGADDARGGVFLSGRFSSGDRDATGLEPGLDYEAGGGTLGVDYRTGASTFVGIAAGYSDSSSDFSNQGGALGLEAESLTAYLTFAGERFYLDVVAGLGSDSFDLRRSLALPDGSGGTFTVDGSAAPDGEERTLELGFGWDFPAGASTWTIAARGSWVDIEIDSFVETLGAGVQMQIFNQNVESVLAEAAIEWTHSASFDWGVLQPQISAAARHEFEDQAGALRGRFAADPTGGEFVLPTDPADATYFAARAGLSAIFPRGWALYAHGESEFGRDDLSVTTLSAGFRVEW